MLGNFVTLISVGQEAKNDVFNTAIEPASSIVCLCHFCLLLTLVYLKINQLDLFFTRET